jgi:tetratricopeptide (TPR) repeat protein
MCFAELGQFKDAIEKAREGMRAGEDLGQTYAFGYAVHRLGYAYLLKGDINQALPLLEQCRELAERAELPVLTVHLGSCLGQAYCLEGRGEAAVAFVEKAHAMEEAGGNKLWEPVNLATLATAYSLLGRSSEALTTAERALDCARRCGQRSSEASALFAVGEVLAACEPRAYTRCVETYTAALVLSSELKMRPLIARCHLALAMLSGGKANERLQHRDTAREMFREMDMRLWLERAESALKVL